MKRLPFRLLAALLVLAACRDPASTAAERATISVVGSSTVFPFTTAVAEAFVAADPDAAAPTVESTGTGAGMRLFCAGVGAAHPDMTDASRRMRASEYADCARHGAGALLEIPIGLDGVAIATGATGRITALSSADLYRALAAEPDGRPNRARTWHDVDPALPPTPILVYGPPATSGTRDAFADLILTRGCAATRPGAAALALRDPAAHAPLCTRLREDGAYADAGENDNLIVQKLVANPEALGVFGYAYLQANRGAAKGVAIDGASPTHDAIARGRYPGARPLFLYVKKVHLDAVPGLRALLRLYVASIEPGGLLARRGLIAAPLAVRRRAETVVAREITLDPRTLH